MIWIVEGGAEILGEGDGVITGSSIDEIDTSASVSAGLPLFTVKKVPIGSADAEVVVAAGAINRNGGTFDINGVIAIACAFS